MEVSHCLPVVVDPLQEILALKQKADAGEDLTLSELARIFELKALIRNSL